MGIILKAENISKQYRLGLVGTGTLKHDFNRFLARIQGKEDPYLKVGAENDRSKAATESYVWALRDINFEVEEGEVLGIIGKNGAGKSTLLKLLSRVTSPTTGVIKTRGRIASLLEVGTGFHPELTGRENIYLNGAILGMTKAEIRSKEEEIVNFSGCAMYIDTPVKRYSSGMRVRLAFAVAAHLEPDILVVDEVLAVGDADFQKKAIGKMQDMSKGDGRTVLFVSHNMAAVQNLCTRAIVLENGLVKHEGDTEEVVEKYLSNETSEINTFKSTYVKSARILNQDEKPADKIMMGASFTIEIIASNIDTVKGPHLGFFIIDSSDQKISAFSTAMKKVNIVHEDTIDDETYLFKIMNPNLIEGTYFLDISVAYKTGGRVDYISKVLSFDIVATDVYGNGVLFNNHFGKVYLDVETTVKLKS